MRRLWFAAFGSLLLGPPLAAQPQAGAEDIAARAKQVLGRYCHNCHQGEGSASGYDFDVLKPATLTAKVGDTPAYVIPGKPDESELYTIAAKNRMPPKAYSGPRPAAADVEALKAWVAAGAPAFPADQARPFIALKDVLRAIRDDISALPARDRRYTRYFTLTHLHNNASVSSEQLRLTRAALSKAVNGLHWEATVVVPRAVEKTSETVYAVDLRKLGWGAEQWRAILVAYPYGLRYAGHQDEALKDLDGDALRLADHADEILHVRADWFISTATRPPLYHALLYDNYLPELKARHADPLDLANPRKMTARDLETFLRIDVATNILGKDPRALRAGFPRSGVSGQNRLIERHPQKGPGAYWKSYDFKASTWEANLSQFPLGPKLPGNSFDTLAFVHDGGEIIFHLPNGLQGYLLVDGKDRRIDAGPIEVVSDALKTSGTAAIVNGLSCMACHKNGTIDPPADRVRAGSGVFGAARDRVRLLYPEQKEMERWVQADADLYLRSAERAYGSLLRVGADKDRPARELPEPVGEVARRYLLADLDLATAAAELYAADPKKLRAKIEDSDELKRLGLGALATDGGTVKRGAWENFRGSSQMQQTARELGFTPFRVLPR